MNERPLVPEDLTRLAPSTYLVRAAVAHLKAFIDGGTPEQMARSLYGRDTVTPTILRAATGTAKTTTIGWAAELARIAIFDLVQSITSISAAATIIDRGMQINMDGIAEYRIPGRVLNVGAAGIWTAEDAPAVVRQLSFSNAAFLHARKLTCIMSYTREQAESSNIEAIVRQTMGEAVGLALDGQMFSATAEDASKPAGLFYGIAGQTPTTGGGVAAMEGDLKNLFTALAAQQGGKNAVIVAALPEAVVLKMHVGPKFDYDILASTGIPAGSVAVIELGSFVSGFGSTPQFTVSRDAALHFDDTAPADPIMGGVPVHSMYQVDGLALRMTLRAAWGLRAPGHAQWLTGATW